MSRCPACSAPIDAAAIACPACGASLDEFSATPTGTAPRGTPVSPAGAPRPTPVSRGSSGASGRTPSNPASERFAPGTLLISRYRVVGQLGRGGMGEVFRADDLVLGLPVALKFLPEPVARDPERLTRFFNEVRLAREISHPAVCRVHDVAELEGQPFLSMEFVDGENLASLLRRIGRLPADKALELARQLCAGLAAAHDKGVLHRDLKPENVMIDGRGRARITDFGLAAVAEDVHGAEVRSGTPAYMSPEQLAGREVTARSDVYALGLVLYELFCGRRAFDGRTLAELTRQHVEQDAPRLAALVADLDPAIDRAVMRCLEKDPARRPASALLVSRSLPGGDPLAAALAAGETPSPEMVAAAGSEGALAPLVALGLAVLAVLVALATIALGRSTSLVALLPFDKPPEVLEDRARDMLRELGAGTGVDEAGGFATDGDLLRHVAATDTSLLRWERLRAGRPAAVAYWYRESPRLLIGLDRIGQVMWNSPEADVAGMSGVALDLQGRLLEFYRVTPQVESEAAATAHVDWSRLLTLAGLDALALRPTTPAWTPPFWCDTRAAWTGTHPGAPDVPLTVEAAAYRGQPVFFRIVQSWTHPERQRPFERTPGQKAANRMGAIIFVGVILAATLLALRNRRLGRGDVRGAFRVALWSFLAVSSGWVLDAHHVPELVPEVLLASRAAGTALLVGALLWALYMALEPQVRRRWPHVLIGWSRLLAGRFSDPRVGRDVLLGTLAGSVAALAFKLASHLPAWLGHPPPAPEAFRIDALLGWRTLIPMLIDQHVEAVAIALGLLLLTMVLRAVLRRELLAAAAVALIFAVEGALGSTSVFWVDLLVLFVGWSVPMAVLMRLGLLAHVVCFLSLALVVNFPLSLDVTHWTGHPTLVVLAAVAALASYGFHVARAGHPLLHDEL